MPSPTPPDLPGEPVQRAAERFVSRQPGIISRHCFSFGEHYDPRKIGFGRLVAVNDEVLTGGAGFPAHRHAGLDIVTWVVQGQLEYADGAGRVALSSPGVVQTLQTGSGIEHSEINAGAGVCRFVQFWLAAPADRAPTFAQCDVSRGLAGESLGPVARVGGATLFAARLGGAMPVALPTDPRLFVFVVRGSATIFPVGELRQGDSARLTSSGGGALTSGPLGVELLVCAMTY